MPKGRSRGYFTSVCLVANCCARGDFCQWTESDHMQNTTESTTSVSYLNAYSSGHLTLSHLGLAFVLMLRPFFPELVMSTDFLRFEHSSVLLFCLLPSIRRDGQLHTSIYDKRDDFHFHITNFPFLGSNIWFPPVYGVFLHPRLYDTPGLAPHMNVFILRTRRLSCKLLKQRYLMERLKSSFRKFMVDTGILFSNMKFSSHECYMTF